MRATYLRSRCIPHEPFRPALVYTANERSLMALSTILLIIVLLLLVGALPTWPHSRSWGYAPSGSLGLVLVILVLLLVLGHI